MLSRREWIGRLLTLVGLAGVTPRSDAAEAPAKVTQADAHYQDHPNDRQMCGMCKFYIPSGGRAGSGMMSGSMGPGMMAAATCEVVEGHISPMGWCTLYRSLSS